MQQNYWWNSESKCAIDCQVYTCFSSQKHGLTVIRHETLGLFSLNIYKYLCESDKFLTIGYLVHKKWHQIKSLTISACCKSPSLSVSASKNRWVSIYCPLYTLFFGPMPCSIGQLMRNQKETHPVPDTGKTPYRNLVMLLAVMLTTQPLCHQRYSLSLKWFTGTVKHLGINTITP